MYKESLKILSAIILACGILFFISRFTTGNEKSISSTISQSTNQAQVVASNTADIQEHGQTYPVVRVVDGDTIVVSIDNKNESVRLIGVNTPETVDPRTPVQCFGKEASDFVKTILTGKMVRLQSDPTQADRDKYGRLLRYVYLDDVLINEEIISAGFGYEYTYDVPYIFQKEFKASEVYAREGKLGLWAPHVCGK